MSDITSWLAQQQQQYQKKLAAWNRAFVSPNPLHNPAQIRVDAYGSYIVWDQYGKTAQNGWEIDHELPKSQFPGVATHPGNLRALHWKNNRAKSDKLGIDTLRNLLGGQ